MQTMTLLLGLVLHWQATQQAVRGLSQADATRFQQIVGAYLHRKVWLVLVALFGILLVTELYPLYRYQLTWVGATLLLSAGWAAMLWLNSILDMLSWPHALRRQYLWGEFLLYATLAGWVTLPLAIAAWVN